MIYTISKDNLKYKFPKFKLGKDIWIAGGAIRDSIINKKFNDIDVFGTNRIALEQFIRDNFTDNKYDGNWEQIYDSYELETFKHKIEDIKVQIVFKTFPSIEQCLEHFDFTICQFAYDGVNIYLSDQSLIHLIRKELHPVTTGIDAFLLPKTIKRLEKYVRYGYTISVDLIEFLVKSIREVKEECIMEQSIKMLRLFDKGEHYKEWNLD